MSAVCSKADDGSLLFWCPGCQMHHGPVVERTELRPSGPLWEWNGIEFLSDCTHELAGKTVPLETFK